MPIRELVGSLHVNEGDIWLGPVCVHTNGCQQLQDWQLNMASAVNKPAINMSISLSPPNYSFNLSISQLISRSIPPKFISTPHLLILIIYILKDL